MTTWAPGDKAVAKETVDWPMDPCMMKHRIEKRKIYLVKAVSHFAGTLHLDIGMSCRCFDYCWPHYHFEKLVAADKDIFRLADAPVDKTPELEDA